MEESLHDPNTFHVPGGLTYERYMKNVENKGVFDAFRKANLNNPEFRGKFVAFIDCKFAGVGEKRSALVRQMREKFGRVDMHVSKITDKEKVLYQDTFNFRLQLNSITAPLTFQAL